MGQSRFMLAVASVWLVASGADVRAADPNWPTLPYTAHSVFQGVDGDGFGTYPVFDGNPVRMKGVILNDPRDMLDPTPGSDPFMGGQWQIFIQTVEVDDFGGTACWMGQNIGKIMGTHPEGSYTDAEWLAELERIDYDPNTGRAFGRGDLVEIRARAPGLHFGGKTNINEQHSNDPGADFDVVLLQADYGLPTPDIVTLADVKAPDDAFIFDPNRLVGAERYQATLVRVNDVAFISTANWGPDGELEIQDGTGRTMPVRLGRGGGFSVYPPPAPPFDIVALFDQEDGNPDDGYMDGYRLWAMDYDGNGEVINGEVCTGDLNGDGSVTLADLAELLGHYGTVNAAYSDGDLDRDGDVDLADLAELLGHYGTVCW